MAVNHADGMIFSSVILCPIAAAAGAAHAGAGWLSVIFIPAGFAAGLGIFCVGRKPVYAIVEFGFRRVSKMPPGWMRQMFFAPFFVAYVILPLVILGGGVFATWAGSIWLARHVL